MRKMFTAQDVYESIDLRGHPHGGEFAFDSNWSFYENKVKCMCDMRVNGDKLLRSIAESLTYDGTDGP